MRYLASCAVCFLAGAMPVPPASAMSETAAYAAVAPIEPAAAPQLEFVQYGQCWQRQGPFVTQDTAWQRWREARAQGFAVSNGVVPYYEGSSRFYCFYVYYNC